MSKILIVILLTAAILRFYKLDSFPVSIYWDEAAIGYNAYSIAQTARDEYGTKLPLLFKSFNDFKLPGYIYLDAIFVKIFGLSIFTTRLPSALFGTLAPLAIYLITKELLDHKIALLGAFLLAISPWHIQFSRGAFEATIAFTILLFGLLLLLYGLKNKLWAFLSLPILSLSLYFYLSTRLIVPLAVIIFFLIYRKEIKKNLHAYFNGLLLAIIISVPIAASIFSYSALKHVKEVSIFEDKSLAVDYVQVRERNNDFISKIFLNRRIPYVFESLHKYFSHFSPGFLFFGDDPNPRHHSAFQGNLYLFEIPLLLIGFRQLLLSKNKNAKYFLLAVLFISPLPAAISRDTPHSLRSLPMLLPITINSSLGLLYLSKNLKLRITFTVLVVIFFINYLISYYRLYPQRDSISWAYGYQQMYRVLSNLENNYDRIVVTGFHWKPYIYYLYFNKIAPSSYQEYSNIEAIGKYRFGTTYWDSGGKNLDESQIDKLKGNTTLLVLSPQELQDLKDKSRFHQLQSVSDYSGRNSLFLIGEWQ